MLPKATDFLQNLDTFEAKRNTDSNFTCLSMSKVTPMLCSAHPKEKKHHGAQFRSTVKHIFINLKVGIFRPRIEIILRKGSGLQPQSIDFSFLVYNFDL